MVGQSTMAVPVAAGFVLPGRVACIALIANAQGCAHVCSLQLDVALYAMLAPRRCISSRLYCVPPTMSQLCALLPHLLSAVCPGTKFYKHLSVLLPAVSSGLTYSPVSKADLDRGYPAQGWNETPKSAPAAAVAPAAAAAVAAGTSPAGSTPRATAPAAGSSAAGRAFWAALHAAAVEFTPAAKRAGSGSRKISTHMQAAGAETRTAEGAVVAGSRGSQTGLQQLLGNSSLKWRAILPSGDRVGPFSSADMVGWLMQGKAPRGVSREDAGKVLTEPESLQLCGILANDYNAQKLPGMCSSKLIVAYLRELGNVVVQQGTG